MAAAILGAASAGTSAAAAPLAAHLDDVVQTEGTTPPPPPVPNTALTASTAYAYAVRPHDAAGNTRAQSASPTTTTSADADFQTRRTAPGVILSEGFDNLTPASFPSSCGGGWPTPSNPQCYNPAADGTTHVFLDQTVYSSGDASTGTHKALRLDTTNVAAANVAGDYFMRWPQAFGQNSHFYVQYRMRMNGFVSGSAPWTSPNIGGDGWKTMLFANQTGPLCGGIELATVNFYYSNELRLYTRCGGAIGDSFDLPADGLYGFIPNWLYQQGNYRCAYGGTPNRQTDCAMFHGDQWMTFYYDVNIGTWDQVNSYVKVYVDYGDGVGYRQWIDAPNYRLSANAGTGAYGMADFTNYITKKTSSTPSPATYSTWYDEFILSTQPIAAPGGSTPPPASIFYAVTPCRVVDTRGPSGPLGGPALAAGSQRAFALTATCNVPALAKSVSANITVVSPTTAGEFRLYPADQGVPNTSTLSFRAGQTRANNALLRLAGDGSGGVAVQANIPSGTAHIVIDVNGYFQ